MGWEVMGYMGERKKRRRIKIPEGATTTSQPEGSGPREGGRRRTAGRRGVWDGVSLVKNTRGCETRDDESARDRRRDHGAKERLKMGRER